MINRNASNPACSVQREASLRGSWEERVLARDRDAGRAAGRRGGAGRCAFLSSQEPICEAGYSRRNVF